MCTTGLTMWIVYVLGSKGFLLDCFLLSVSAASCGTLDRLWAIVFLIFVFVWGDLSFAAYVESWMWMGCTCIVGF